VECISFGEEVDTTPGARDRPPVIHAGSRSRRPSRRCSQLHGWRACVVIAGASSYQDVDVMACWSSKTCARLTGLDRRSDRHVVVVARVPPECRHAPGRAAPCAGAAASHADLQYRRSTKPVAVPAGGSADIGRGPRQLP
jgi:hypothetical protein